MQREYISTFNIHWQKCFLLNMVPNQNSFSFTKILLRKKLMEKWKYITVFTFNQNIAKILSKYLMWLFFIESTMNMILELSCHSNYQLKDIWKCLVGICRLFKHDRHYLQRKWINLVRPKSLIKTNNTLFHEHILTTYILYIHTVE